MTTTTRHHVTYSDPLVVGEVVHGFARGSDYSTPFRGTYRGIRRSEHTGEPVRLFEDGIIGGVPQRSFAHPLAMELGEHGSETARVLNIIDKHMAAWNFSPNVVKALAALRKDIIEED